MPRLKGDKGVIINGHVMTTQDYKNVAKQALQANGNNWMTTAQIVDWAAANNLCEPKKAKRKATTHPMWKIMTLMMDDGKSNLKLRFSKNGILEYQIDPAKVEEIYVNGIKYVRHKDMFKPAPVKKSRNTK